MCHPRGSYDPLENREPTGEEHETSDESDRLRDESLVARAKARLVSLFDTPGEDGRREPEPTMQLGDGDD